jgi:subtilase family serine protease
MRKVVVLAAAALLVLPTAGLAFSVPHSLATLLTQRSVCAAAPAGFAQCEARLVTEPSGEAFDGKPAPLAQTAPPAGFRPADLLSAYKLNPPIGAPGTGQTIGIVDAYNDPDAESNLAYYRSEFGLGACTTANHCFKKVNQTGGSQLPRAEGSWAEEISLDLDMASAICPNCKIVLVEAQSPSIANLGVAENTAASLGANTISNSYGGAEYPTESAIEADYKHTAVTAAAGDEGYGVEFPASSRYVTAVGGTSLARDAETARGWSESVWSGSGSGCSAYVEKPSWQKDTGCPRRTVVDVAAVANPQTGVAVYDSYAPSRGWTVFGGTSVATPIIAGVYALAGNAASITSASFAYEHAGSLFDVTGGSNGSCGGSYLCTGLPGYDGPTGLGTPDGTGAF